MAVHLHAVILLSVPVATLVFCVIFRRRRRPPSMRGRPTWRVPTALTVGLFFAFGGVILWDRGHGAAGPFVLRLIPALCVVAIILCVSPWRLVAASSGVLLIVMSLLKLWNIALAHEPGYTGDPYHDEFLREWQCSALDGVGEWLRRRAREDKASYPEGWLAESVPPAKSWAYFESYRSHASWRATVTPLWHSWLTGLYGCTLEPMDLWYPGGTLKDAASKIEFRDRPLTKDGDEAPAD